MKKYIGFAILAGLMFSFSFALSDDNESKRSGDDSSRKEEFQQKMRMNQESFRERFKNEGESFSREVKMKRDEFRSFGSDKKREFWGRAKDMFTRRFDVAVANLERVQDRVDALIDKLNAENEDTELAQEYLNSSLEKLKEAKAELAEIKALLPESGEKISPEIFEQIKLGARETKNLLKESHHDLILAVQELKGLKGDDDRDEEEDN